MQPNSTRPPVSGGVHPAAASRTSQVTTSSSYPRAQEIHQIGHENLFPSVVPPAPPAPPFRLSFPDVVRVPLNAISPHDERHESSSQQVVPSLPEVRLVTPARENRPSFPDVVRVPPNAIQPHVRHDSLSQRVVIPAPENRPSFPDVVRVPPSYTPNPEPSMKPAPTTRHNDLRDRNIFPAPTSRK